MNKKEAQKKMRTDLDRVGEAGTITFKKLQKMSFCNSADLVENCRYIIGGRIMNWVGYGFADEGKACLNVAHGENDYNKYPVVVEGEE